MTEDQRTKEAAEAERMRHLRKMRKNEKKAQLQQQPSRLEREDVRWEEQTDLINKACVLEGGKIVSTVTSRMGRKRRVTLTTEQLRASSKKSRKTKKKKVL